MVCTHVKQILHLKVVSPLRLIDNKSQTVPASSSLPVETSFGADAGRHAINNLSEHAMPLRKIADGE